MHPTVLHLHSQAHPVVEPEFGRGGVGGDSDDVELGVERSAFVSRHPTREVVAVRFAEEDLAGDFGDRFALVPRDPSENGSAGDLVSTRNHQFAIPDVVDHHEERLLRMQHAATF